jgi:hypothetical protein
MSEGVKTPEEIALELFSEVGFQGWDSLRISIATAIRDAYERAAVLAEEIGDSEHDQARDPQEDNSDRAGEKIAAAIRTLKGKS